MSAGSWLAAVGRRPWAVLAAGAIAGLVSGVALGVVWWRLAPRVPLVVQPGGSYPQGYQPDGWLAADAAFALLAAIAGVAIAIGLAQMRREHLVTVLLGALIAGAIGGAAMWFVGTHLGDVDIDGLVATTTQDVVVEAPLRVTMPAVFLVWPFASAVVISILSFGDWLGARRAAKRAMR